AGSRTARTCGGLCPRDNATGGNREVARGSMAHVSDLNKYPPARRGCEPCLHILPSRCAERQGSSEPVARPSLRQRAKALRFDRRERLTRSIGLSSLRCSLSST